ncbi:DUF1707 SHOCT-like domain-containing protein [Amycolatopsis sp. CA-230715]|uniref:DUF1707 SHOCT-like domain-containing protein n=1 Tax=Amycolatopsis sp. CA-230715 TaxID=2745196 RepID=UPI001C01A00C|nr:DUF1707 domain-containing protein [Amycolatopsis sp. CA-230715]QWF79558.1 hypothetical protein HUW46_02966 [Amycolatopsis sp. CA-230715]
MDTNPARLRASDAERERIAQLVERAGADGRLTLAEIEERLGRVYAARYTDELTELTADLPEPAPPAARRGVPRPLRVHAAVVAVVATALVVRWVAGSAQFFWPVVPLFWLALSLVAHARIRRFAVAGRRAVPY